MSDPDAAYPELAGVFSGLANRARLAILMGIYHGHSMQTVTATLEITRSGVQKHLDTLIDTDLVYRPATGEQTYALTPLGHVFAVFLDHYGTDLTAAVAAIDAAEAAAREEFAEVPLSDQVRDREVTRRKWALLDEAVSDRLAALEARLTE